MQSSATWSELILVQLMAVESLSSTTRLQQIPNWRRAQSIINIHGKIFNPICQGCDSLRSPRSADSRARRERESLVRASGLFSQQAQRPIIRACLYARD